MRFGENGNEGRFLFPLFFGAGNENGNEGRFLFPLFFEKWEKEPSLIPIFSLFLSEKWEKEPSLIPSPPLFLLYYPQEVNPMRILVAEDDRDLNKIIVKKLTAEGNAVDGCFDGRAALDYIEGTDYDVVILDIMMPEMDGLEAVRRLRSRGDLTPVIFLTAKDTVADRVAGLDMGANDYIVKPFSFDELSARIRAVTRTASHRPSNLLALDDLVLNTETGEVRRGGEVIALTAREYRLLEYLLRNQNKVLSRQKIENNVWNYDYEGGTNVVDVYISYLRKKIDDGAANKLIHTVHGVGYCMRVEP